MVLCIDSQIFIWGIKKQCTEGQENMIQRAEYFFKWADEEKHHLLIPTVVIAEILAPEPKETHAELMSIISDNFIIGNFDTLCAIRYANLLNNRFEDLKEFAKDNGIRREKMKTDHMIVSTALAYNANIIYSNDAHLKTYAKGLILVSDVPQMPNIQSNIFDDDNV